MKRVPLLLVGALLLAATLAGAGEPTLQVSLNPPRFGIEDTTQLTVTITDPGRRAPSPHIGELENLKVVAGPSTENQFSWVNGVATSSLSFTYILRAEAVGPAKVGTVIVTVGETVLRSEPITAEVVDGSVAPPRSSRNLQRRPFDPFADLYGQRSVAEAKIALRQQVSKRRLYLGETVNVAVVLDTTVAGIEGFEWVEIPSYPGWWTQRVELPEQITPEIVTIDNERYQRFTIARFVLVPLKKGNVTLAAPAARIGVRSGGVFARQRVVERSAKAIEVTVVDRPQPPAGFAGAVGSLRYRGSLEPTEIELGESAVLTIELEGEGNLPLVEEPPHWPSCEGCDTYPPEQDGEVKVDKLGIHGSRSWRMTVLPRNAGELQLSPVKLAVFDPAAGVYRQQSIGPMSLNVNPPPPTPTPTVAPEVAATRTAVADAPGGNGQGGPGTPLSLWQQLLVPFVAAVLGGLVGAWLMSIHRRTDLPPRRPDQSPADRARELQAVLESWWFSVRDTSRAEQLRPVMDDLRRELEGVRFAPGRADHTETIKDLEDRLRRLVRRRR